MLRDSVKADIVMTDAQFGMLTSAFLWVYGLLSPVGGFIADRFSRKWVIIGSLGAWSAVTWLTGFVHTFDQMLAARALLAVGQAFYIPAGLALVADLHGSATRSRATGLHMSGLYAGAALSGLGGLAAEHCGWRNAFSWFGLAGVAYAVVLSWLLRDGREAGADEIMSAPTVHERISLPQALHALFGQASFLALLAYFTLFALANWGINGWLPTYLRERFGLGVGQAGISATGWIQTASFAGVLLGGAWSDRWVRRNPRGRLYVPFIGLCVGGPLVFLMARTDAFAVAILGMSVYGLGRGLADTSTDANSLPACRPPHAAPPGYGFFESIQPAQLVSGTMMNFTRAVLCGTTTLTFPRHFNSLPRACSLGVWRCLPFAWTAPRGKTRRCMTPALRGNGPIPALELPKTISVKPGLSLDEVSGTFETVARFSLGNLNRPALLCRPFLQEGCTLLTGGGNFVFPLRDYFLSDLQPLLISGTRLRHGGKTDNEGQSQQPRNTFFQ